MLKFLKKPIYGGSGRPLLFFTKDQRNNLLSLGKLMDARRFDHHAAGDALLSALYSLYFPDPNVTDNIYDIESWKNPILVFQAMTWVSDTGGYRDIFQIAPVMSKIQFHIRLMGFNRIYGPKFEKLEMGMAKRIREPGSTVVPSEKPASKSPDNDHDNNADDFDGEGHSDSEESDIYAPSGTGSTSSENAFEHVENISLKESPENVSHYR